MNLKPKLWVNMYLIPIIPDLNVLDEGVGGLIGETEKKKKILRIFNYFILSYFSAGIGYLSSPLNGIGELCMS